MKQKIGLNLLDKKSKNEAKTGQKQVLDTLKTDDSLKDMEVTNHRALQKLKAKDRILASPNKIPLKRKRFLKPA